MNPRRSAAVALAALACALLLGACGFGAGQGSSDVSLLVTRDFGTRALGETQPAETSGSETAMRYLERHFDVRTRYGGGFVQAIDGLAGGRRGGQPFDWFYFVNGVQAEQGAAAVTLQPGDRVWWDYHDWAATMRVPAVVGSYPEPFLHGMPGGKPLPVRLECAGGGPGSPCREIANRLGEAGASAGESAIGTPPGSDTLRIVVGPWSDVRRALGGRLLERGPQASGVYARPVDGGRRLQVLDPRGHVVRTLGAATGLIAATRYSDQPPVWYVTGTDAAGVRQAVQAFDRAELTNRFAVAVHGDRAIPLPVTEGRG